MTSRAPLVAAGPQRSQATLGGLVPSSAVARGGDTLVMCLCAEVHAEGAVLPLLALSDAPGVLSWDPAQGLAAEDDAGRAYDVAGVEQQAGLGSLQSDVWIHPAPPPEARELRLTVSEVMRASAARGGGGVERVLTGGPWELRIPLVPERTAADAPPEPGPPEDAPGPGRAPSRAYPAFRGLAPIGQARLGASAAVCLWALERYEDRAVMTMAVLTEEPLRSPHLTRDHGTVEVWDDRGRAYETAPMHGSTRPGWSETSVEIIPAVDGAARVLGVRLAHLPAEGAPPDAPDPLEGPFTFGVLLGTGDG